MVGSASGKLWEEASSPSVTQLVRRFEADWGASAHQRRPDPQDYLPEDGSQLAAARLALLRAEMGLRHEAGEIVRAESYRARYPELDEETLLALIYEEFCLREEAGQAPNTAEYFSRFPELTSPLQRILAIHDLVGSARTVSFTPPSLSAACPFPEVGQTIAGFRLVAELGRGSFGRVYRAEERQLADRPVALKVSRAGSREPQTLARLQHTHIVPVHSYRNDPVTGLHLLCMPYLGGVTLARLLADPQVRSARTGAELLEALDRLEPSPQPGAASTSAARQALAGRTYVRAVAWWGARMAEALQHAHERGVLHRDVKPSNVLVTGDGLPLLLDFNLAWESRIDDPELAPGGLGGTLAYMSPEHLDALARGDSTRVDGRSDVYSLGVVLFEAMGTRPFEVQTQGASLGQTLRRLAEQRRRGAPDLRELHPEVPAEFDAVVRRCLEPDPARRYASAAELAHDLQAVADDQPLRYTREPPVSRSVRWFRRNRQRVAVAVPILLAPALLVYAQSIGEYERARAAGERSAQVKALKDQGFESLRTGNLDRAQAQYQAIRQLAAGATDTELQTFDGEARDKLRLIEEYRDVLRKADTLLDEAESLRLGLLGFNVWQGDVSAHVQRVLKPFFVLEHGRWTDRPELTLLDEPRARKLRATVDDLLFLWAIHLERRGTADAARAALDLCGRALAVTEDPETWRALAARLRGEPHPVAPPPRQVASAQTCFHRAVLAERDAQLQEATAWMQRAIALEPGQYWYRYFLGFLYQQQGRPEEAMIQDQVAAALEPARPWPRISVARLHQARGEWGRALDELAAARALARGTDRAVIVLEWGVAQEAIGALDRARAAYAEIVAGSAELPEPLVRAARFNTALVDLKDGRPAAALEAFESLLREEPTDGAYRFGRARALARLGRFAEAESELDALLRTDPRSLRARAERALVRLARGRPTAAEEDARGAYQEAPSPARERLWLRTRVAAGRPDGLPCLRPERWWELPDPARTLRQDLSRLADAAAASPEPGARLLAASLLAALDRTEEARSFLLRLRTEDSGAVGPIWLQAALDLRDGRLEDATLAVAEGRARHPMHVPLAELQAEILLRQSRPGEALELLDARPLRADARARGPLRARALEALRDDRSAVETWTQVLRLDRENPLLFLARARALARLGLVTQALSDLEQAAATSADRPAARLILVTQYAALLPAAPDRWPRVAGLAWRLAAGRD